MNALHRRIQRTLLLAVAFAMVLAVPASGATTWRTQASATSRAGTEFVSAVTVGASFRQADAVRLQFRSPDGKARTVEVWFYAECADGRTKEIDMDTPARITTAAGGGWTNVTIFKTGSKAGECWVEGGGWYPASSKELAVRLRVLAP
jgi:hypothetical protein